MNDNIPNDLALKLKERYNFLHPLVFYRSLEKAKSPSHLFDTLETIPEFPFLWVDNCWKNTTDLSQISKFELIEI